MPWIQECKDANKIMFKCVAMCCNVKCALFQIKKKKLFVLQTIYNEFKPHAFPTRHNALMGGESKKTYIYQYIINAILWLVWYA